MTRPKAASNAGPSTSPPRRLPPANSIRIQLSTVPSPRPSSRPSASRRTGVTGCSSCRTTRPRWVSAAKALSTRNGISSVTISATARVPAADPGRVTRTDASPGRRVRASVHKLAAALASASGVAAANSASATPA